MDSLAALCGKYPGTSRDTPFGPQPVCYRIAGRRIFAQLYPQGRPGALRILQKDESIPRERLCPMATFSCEAAFGQLMRNEYPAAVLRPYYSPPAQQPYAITILLNGTLDDDTWAAVIDHAYETTLRKLPKRVQADLATPR